MRVYEGLEHWVVCWIDQRGRVHILKFNSQEEALEFKYEHGDTK